MERYHSMERHFSAVQIHDMSYIHLHSLPCAGISQTNNVMINYVFVRCECLHVLNTGFVLSRNTDHEIARTAAL